MVSGFKSPNSSPSLCSKALSIANATALTEKMESIFSEIKDPRVKRNRVHLLTDILIIAILSVNQFWILDFRLTPYRRCWGLSKKF